MWFLEKWLENPKTVKKMVYLLYVSLIISCLLGIAIHFAPPAEHVEHVPFVFEQIPIFSAIFGFIICILLGLGSKAYGHNVVMKEGDYYDN
ncbi:MAG: hypothetical protein J7J03_06085 [Methanosarcinales archaeon]|nr:hypothetical protein [Methanosarcinales archaeon]